MRKLTDMEAVDAERYYQLWAGSRNDIPAGEPSPGNEREAFFGGIQSMLELIDRTRLRAGFEEERFKRAYILASQLRQLLVQSVMILDGVRKRLVVGPDEKPVDTLGIGKTLEAVVPAVKSADNVLALLKDWKPENNGQVNGG